MSTSMTDWREGSSKTENRYSGETPLQPPKDCLCLWISGKLGLGGGSGMQWCSNGTEISMPFSV